MGPGLRVLLVAEDDFEAWLLAQPGPLGTYLKTIYLASRALAGARLRLAAAAISHESPASDPPPTL